MDVCDITGAIVLSQFRRNGIDVDATVLFNLLWRRHEGVQLNSHISASDSATLLVDKNEILSDILLAYLNARSVIAQHIHVHVIDTSVDTSAQTYCFFQPTDHWCFSAY